MPAEELVRRSAATRVVAAPVSDRPASRRGFLSWAKFAILAIFLLAPMILFSDAIDLNAMSDHVRTIGGTIKTKMSVHAEAFRASAAAAAAAYKEIAARGEEAAAEAEAPDPIFEEQDTATGRNDDDGEPEPADAAARLAVAAAHLEKLEAKHAAKDRDTPAPAPAPTPSVIDEKEADGDGLSDRSHAATAATAPPLADDDDDDLIEPADKEPDLSFLSIPALRDMLSRTNDTEKLALLQARIAHAVAAMEADIAAEEAAVVGGEAGTTAGGETAAGGKADDNDEAGGGGTVPPLPPLSLRWEKSAGGAVLRGRGSAPWRACFNNFTALMRPRGERITYARHPNLCCTKMFAMKRLKYKRSTVGQGATVLPMRLGTVDLKKHQELRRAHTHYILQGFGGRPGEGWLDPPNNPFSASVKKGGPNAKRATGLYHATRTKQFQARALASLAQDRGCALNDLRVMPATYDLRAEKQCRALFATNHTRWLLKPRHEGHGGEGIRIVASGAAWRKMRAQYRRCPKHNEFAFMAQAYVDPFLIDGRKFDFRTYMLVASADPVTVFFNYGNLRRSLFAYGTHNRAAHLTNYHQQLQYMRDHQAPGARAKFVNRALWPYRRFAEYLWKTGVCRSDLFDADAEPPPRGPQAPARVQRKAVSRGRRRRRPTRAPTAAPSPPPLASLPPCAFERQFAQQLRLIAHATGLMTLPRISPRKPGVRGRWPNARRVGAVNVLGMDFMLDKDLRLHFIEANESPGMEGHGVRWKARMSVDLWVGAMRLTRMLHERPSEFRLAQGDRYAAPGVAADNWWELVANEQQEACERAAGGAAFDPCPARV